MMGKSWNETKHARTGIATAIILSGIVPGISIARSVLISTSSSSLDVIETGYSFAMTGGCSYD